MATAFQLKLFLHLRASLQRWEAPGGESNLAAPSGSLDGLARCAPCTACLAFPAGCPGRSCHCRARRGCHRQKRCQVSWQVHLHCSSVRISRRPSRPISWLSNSRHHLGSSMRQRSLQPAVTAPMPLSPTRTESVSRSVNYFSSKARSNKTVWIVLIEFNHRQTNVFAGAAGRTLNLDSLTWDVLRRDRIGHLFVIWCGCRVRLLLLLRHICSPLWFLQGSSYLLLWIALAKS